MKKYLSLIMASLMLLMLLSGCVGCSNPDGSGNGNSIFTLPDWMSGSDAAKLLLAGQRLDSQLLKNDGNIFDNGADVMRGLAQKAKDNLNLPYVGSDFENLSAVENLAGEVIGENTRGTLIKDGDTLTFSDFVENNNTYDYFESVTGNIVTSAEVAADLIDSIKKNVRVVDKWIDMGNVKYYLHVEENSELLIEHYTGDDGMGTELDILNICMRYRNSEGKDVYELYRNSRTEYYQERMTYIPGERYELTMKHMWSGVEGSDSFIADNSKGYWETAMMHMMEDAPSHSSYFVMKDDLCYEAGYNPELGEIPMLKVMSGDRATDMLNVYSDRETYMGLTLKFSGFDGIKNVVASLKDEGVVFNEEGQYANVGHGEVATVNFTNGKSAKYGDTFLDGKVSIGSIYVMYVAGDIYLGEMMVDIRADSFEEQFEILKQFLNEVGLVCRRDIDTVLSAIDVAYNDADGIIKYYTWNGISVVDSEGLDAAAIEEYKRMEDMLAYYTEVKDAEVLDINDREAIEMNINFAPITESSFSGFAIDGGNASIANLSLTIEDTTLYVKDEPYKIMLALVDAGGGLVHFDMVNETTVKYADEDKFTVSASALDFKAPILSAGKYTLAAYIATSDGIRASAFAPVVSDSDVPENSLDVENINLIASLDDETRAVVFTYTEKEDFEISLTGESRLDYSQFKTLVSQKVFEYGTPSEVLEVKSGEDYVVLTGEETEIADGVYRMAYKTENGEKIKQGYIFIHYSRRESN